MNQQRLKVIRIALIKKFAKIEAKGFGISITTKIEKGESPLESADRLVSKEQRIRKSRYYSWIKSINEKKNKLSNPSNTKVIC